MAGKTYYPGFSRRLYSLQRYLAAHSDRMKRRMPITGADATALDTLQTAVQTGTQYFPEYTEEA
jgi:hypothetical protein